MSTVKELVDALPSGWSVVSSYTPIEETKFIPNPAATINGVPDPKQPAQIEQGTGQYYVLVKDPNGNQRALFLKASADQGVPAPGLQPTPPVTGRTAPPGTKVTSDLNSISWDQAGVVQDAPASATKVTPTPTAQMDRIGPNGQVIPPGDTTTKVIELRDPKTDTHIPVPADPAGAVHDVGDEVWLIKPDGTHTVVGSKPTKADTLNVPGVGLVEYDPSKPAGSRTTVVMPTPTNVSDLGGLQTRNGKTYVPTRGADGQVSFVETSLPADTQVGYTFDDPSSKWITFYDKQGQKISQTEKPDWQPKPNYSAGQGPAADLVSKTIPTVNPQSGALEFVDNPNQVTASEATSQLASQLGLKVAAGSMSEKAAQDLITNAVNTMNAQTQQQQNQVTAAGDILSNVRGNAQTGAGLLQQRAQTAQGMLGQVLGLAQSGQRSGNFGGGLLSAPPGLGAGLVSGIGDWTSQLMGGQATMDSAARLVQMADPRSNLADPSSQQAISALTQMLDRYHQITGAPHPAVAATTAMNQTQQNGGVVAPVTAPNPAYASTGLGAVTAGYGSSGSPWGNAPNGFPAPTTIQNPYASSGVGAVGAGFAAPSTGPTIVIHT